MSGVNPPRRPPLTRAQQILVTNHVYLVLLIAGALIAARPFTALPYDELVSLGNVGLVEAAQAFDPTRGVTFEGFAWKRIHGAMMNGIRHEKAVVIAARKALYRCSDFPADEGDIMHDTEQDDLDHLESIADAMAVALCFGAAGNVRHVSALGGEAALELREEYADLVAALDDALSSLPELERRLIHLRYYEGRKLYEVAALLPLPESSTRHLHADILKRLGRRLRTQGVMSATVLQGCPP